MKERPVLNSLSRWTFNHLSWEQRENNSWMKCYHLYISFAVFALDVEIVTFVDLLGVLLTILDLWMKIGSAQYVEERNMLNVNWTAPYK